MKFQLGGDDVPWLLFLLAAAILSMVLLSARMETGHQQTPTTKTVQK